MTEKGHTGPLRMNGFQSNNLPAASFEYPDTAGIWLMNPGGQFRICPVSVGTLKQQSNPFFHIVSHRERLIRFQCCLQTRAFMFLAVLVRFEILRGLQQYTIDADRPGRFAERGLHPPLRHCLYPYVAD
jgi:hypothetical protein